MSENILVVEYEPRYTDRVRQALVGQPFHALFAKDGEEAMRALDTYEPKLIVLSSVVPKISAPDLIRVIRGRAQLQKTPILLTVSGYTGTAPKQDAVRMGASDILPKPYSEAEFLGKVQQMLGVGQMTSNEIFGDILEDSAIAHPAARKPMNPKDDVDKMLEQTLAGVMPKKRTCACPKPEDAAPAGLRARQAISGHAVRTGKERAVRRGHDRSTSAARSPFHRARHRARRPSALRQRVLRLVPSQPPVLRSRKKKKSRPTASASVSTCCSRRSPPAGWPRCGRRGCAAWKDFRRSSRSRRSCRTSPTTRTSSRCSSMRRSSPRSSTTTTSSTSTTSARSRARTTSPWSTSMGTT